MCLQAYDIVHCTHEFHTLIQKHLRVLSYINQEGISSFQYLKDYY